ncbi:histone-fold-containing protein [Boeremia exigua]|uniref:histone-fold-containing protein n=1 Tax=Boeremia exigua TaxID=749465 RepID=UPI001E8EBAD3|nr:histone-fold-containing protein [Boeremia exigua]KAH6614077.1 histone-fold-containing protein [Boeremia exigua]
MVNERPKQFGGAPRFGGGPRPGVASSSTSRAAQLGIGLGKGAAGLGGLGKGKGIRRHQKIQRDTIQGVTKGDIRRLARRGGVKRISATIYDDVRQALKARLSDILREVVAVVEHTGRQTVSVTDVIFILNRQGRQLYGFDPSFMGRRH